MYICMQTYVCMHACYKHDTIVLYMYKSFIDSIKIHIYITTTLGQTVMTKQVIKYDEMGLVASTV